jgi:hypothetical protein
MNTKLQSICASLFLAASLWTTAGESPAKTASPEFERMKTLVGTWQGKTDMGQGPVDLTVSYRLIAAGSVLEERTFAGTPNEMVTMYYDKAGKLALTHYCMMGNQPAMTLASADAKGLSFDFDGAACCIKADKESHMHALKLRFDDADTITVSCKAMIEGKESPEHPTTLKRVSATTASIK